MVSVKRKLAGGWKYSKEVGRELMKHVPSSQVLGLKNRLTDMPKQPRINKIEIAIKIWLLKKTGYAKLLCNFFMMFIP